MTKRLTIYLLIFMLINTPLVFSYQLDPQQRIKPGFDEIFADQFFPDFDQSKKVINQNEDWWIDRVDRSGSSGRYTSIALDSHGYPHISYCREDDSGYVKYAQWNGNNWMIETIDTGSGGQNGNVTTTSIIIDSDDHPHIAYARPPNEVIYVQWDGNQWYRDTVISTMGIYGSVDIALDRDGHPHISFCDGYGAYHINYAWYNGSSWVTEVVDSFCRGGIHNSLQLDKNNNPCIAYTAASNGAVKYAEKIDDEWLVSTVDSSTTSYFLYPSLCLDTRDHPHIGYYDVRYDLKYAKKINNDWEVSTVIADEAVGFTYSLALSSDDIPHFIYQELQKKNLCYVFWNESRWQRLIIDNNGAVGCCSQLVLDKHDCACISYRDEGNKNLKFARKQYFSLQCSKPTNYLYFNNKEICDCLFPLILGPIDVTLSISDHHYDITRVDVYVDHDFQTSLSSEPYTWEWDDNLFGSYCLKTIATDTDENQAIKQIEVWKFF